MEREVLVGDKVKYVHNHFDTVYTVVEIKDNGINGERMYRVTHPSMLFPMTGMWVSHSELIHLFQKREEK